MKYVSNSLRYAVKKWNLKLGLESGKTKLQLRPVNLHTILNIEPYETSESQHKMLRGRGRGTTKGCVGYFSVMQHDFKDFIILSKTINQMGIKVYSFGKLTTMGPQIKTGQLNHYHRCYRLEVMVI